MIIKNILVSFRLKRLIFLAASLIVFTLTLNAQYKDIKIDYFGQTPPGNKAVVFAPDFISRNGWYVQNGCFSQDGKEFVFCRSDTAWRGFKVMYTKYVEGKWAEPIMLFPDERNLGMPFFSYDNNCIYFSSSLTDINHDGDIYRSKRNGDKWEKPEKIGYPVSSEDGKEWEVSEAQNGALYFCSTRPGGSGMYDIYKSKPVNGVYSSAENLGVPISTVSYDECPYIAPDESFLVYNSWKYNPKYKGNNLYVSYLDKEGRWGNPIDLGSDINTDELDIYPNITPDGKYLMFTRVKYSWSIAERFSRIYWVSTEILDSIRNLNEEAFTPLTLSSEELKSYEGTYSNTELSYKITITEEGEHLNLSFSNIFECLEAIKKDTFWGHGFTLKFDKVNGTAKLSYDVKGVPFMKGADEIVLKREK